MFFMVLWQLLIINCIRTMDVQQKTNNWKGGKQKMMQPFANYGTLGVSSITNIP